MGKRSQRQRGGPKHRPAQDRPGFPPGVGALLVAALALIAACLYIAPYMPDDAYISFRYAEHLADGHGLTFNPGERLEAYSNFLWIILCALVYRAGFQLPAVAPVMGVLFALGGLVFLWLMARRRSDDPARLLFPLLVYSLATPPTLYAVSGMETPLFACLLMGLLYCADRLYHRFTPGAWTGMTAAGLLLALTRPEGVVVLPAVLAIMSFEAWRAGRLQPTIRFAAVSLGACVTAYGIYTAWRVAYFGAWLPTPFRSKGYEGFTLARAWAKNLEFYFVSGSYLDAPTGWLFVALALAGLAGIVAGRRHPTTRAGDRLALLLAGLMAVVYLNFVDWMPAMRYHAPLIGLLALPLVRALQPFAGRAWPRGFSGTGVRAALVVVVVLSAMGLQRLEPAARTVTETQRERTIPLATWVAAAVPADALVAIGDIGAFSYYSRHSVLDIHPQSLTSAHIAREGFTTDYFLERDPVLVAFNVRGVLVPKMAREHFRVYQNDEFNARYQFIGTVRHNWYLDRCYWIYMHRDAIPPPEILARFPVGVGREQRLGFEVTGAPE